MLARQAVLQGGVVAGEAIRVWSDFGFMRTSLSDFDATGEAPSLFPSHGLRPLSQSRNGWLVCVLSGSCGKATGSSSMSAPLCACQPCLIGMKLFIGIRADFPVLVKYDFSAHVTGALAAMHSLSDIRGGV